MIEELRRSDTRGNIIYLILMCINDIQYGNTKKLLTKLTTKTN